MHQFYQISGLALSCVQFALLASASAVHGAPIQGSSVTLNPTFGQAQITYLGTGLIAHDSRLTIPEGTFQSLGSADSKTGAVRASASFVTNNNFFGSPSVASATASSAIGGDIKIVSLGDAPERGLITFNFAFHGSFENGFNENDVLGGLFTLVPVRTGPFVPIGVVRRSLSFIGNANGSSVQNSGGNVVSNSPDNLAAFISATVPFISGEAFHIEATLTAGSFWIRTPNSLSAKGEVNALNTGMLSFTLPSGYRATGESGFLSNVSTVPEQASWTLMLIGLLVTTSLTTCSKSKLKRLSENELSFDSR